MARHRTLARRRAGVLAAATAALTLAGTAPASAGAAGPAGPPASAGAPGTAVPPEPAGPAGAPEAAAVPDVAVLPDAAVVPETGWPLRRAAGLPRGHDVSSYQKRVDWAAARAKGARFVYIKATESTTYRNPSFSGQYSGARKAGLYRGAYHFALPDRSSGAEQAAYFVRHGGDWRADGRTLPPALDIEYNPYSAKHACYGLGKARMVRWIRSFSDEIKRETGRRPVIYTTAQWWKQCTGNSRAFSSSHALWIARHGTARPGALPGGWRYWTFWQYAVEGRLPGDQNLFNGSLSRLRVLARGR
ncbi:lysozyme [Streptomyces tricolor]|uniref:Lysozyme n=1 Tax=Streptomyces tricolor TaxID=68277 RepID=A0ABS9JVQ6_9ACTN|nr:lysozyme [Streptomyces tricolor]MCG0069649.1 lysozyme [Streptomyces tricolor]